MFLQISLRHFGYLSTCNLHVHVIFHYLRNDMVTLSTCTYFSRIIYDKWMNQTKFCAVDDYVEQMNL